MEWTRTDFTQDNVAKLTFEIHDMYFALKQMRHDEGARLWSLPIGEKQQGPYDREIIVSEVTACRVRDTERIGVYDIHSMVFSAKREELRLKCNVPLGVCLSVAPDFTVRIADLRENSAEGDSGGTHL